VYSDVKGYLNHFGANDVTKERAKIMLKIFSDHMMTILSKLIEGMSGTYLGYLFKDNIQKEESKVQNPAEELEKLANQWSQHQFSPRTLGMSITSIQSAISKEIMCEPFDVTSKEISIPSGIKNRKQFVYSSTENGIIKDEE